MASNYSRIQTEFTKISKKYASFKYDDANAFVEDLRQLRDRFYLHQTLEQQVQRITTDKMQKIDTIKNDALIICSSLLKTGSNEQIQQALAIFKEIRCFDCFCYYNGLNIKVDPLSVDMLLNTRNTSAITNYFLRESVRLSRHCSTQHYSEFIVDYITPYKLILDAFGHNLAKLMQFIKDKKETFSLSKTINGAVDQTEKVFSELSKPLALFFETWRNFGSKILNEVAEESNFAAYTEIMKNANENSKDLGSAIGGLALIFDIQEISATSSPVNFLRKLTAIHAFMVKIRLVASKNKAFSSFEKVLESYPLALDRFCFDSLAENIRTLESEAAEESGLIVYNYLRFLPQHLGRSWKDSEYSLTIDDKKIRERLHEFIEGMLCGEEASASAPTLISVFKDTTKLLLSTQQSDWNQTHSWLFMILKWLIRKDYFQKLNKIMPLTSEFFNFIQETLLNLINLESMATCYQFIYLLLMLSKYVSNSVEYEINRLYNLFESLYKQLYEDLPEKQLQVQRNNDQLKLLWVLYYFTELFKKKFLKKEESSIVLPGIQSILTFIYQKREVYHNSEFVYNGTRYLVRLWFYLLIDEGDKDSMVSESVGQIFDENFIFIEDFYGQAWEKLADVAELFNLASISSIAMHLLIKKNLLRLMLTSSMKGKSAIVFGYNRRKFLDTIIKYFLSDASQQKDARLQFLAKIFLDCQQILAIELEERYMQLQNAAPRVIESSEDLFHWFSPLTQYVDILSDWTVTLLKGASLSPEFRQRRRVLNDTWISRPWSLLVNKHIVENVNLVVSKPDEMTSNYWQIFGYYFAIQTGLRTFHWDKAKILKGKVLLNYLSYYKNFGSLCPPYFIKGYCLDSLKISHYLHFIFNHSIAKYEPFCLKGGFWYQEETTALVLTRLAEKYGLTVERFIMLGVKLFLTISENYFDAYCSERKLEDSLEKVYRDAMVEYFGSQFFKTFTTYLWNSFNYLMIVNGNKKYEAWDEVSLFEEFKEIQLEDLENRPLFAKKVFRNHALMKLIEMSFVENREPLRNTKIFLASIIQKASNLQKLFNWYAVLGSSIDVAQVIKSADGVSWSYLHPAISRLDPKDVLGYNSCFDKRGEEAFKRRCKIRLEVLESFLKNISRYASRSLMVTSDMTPFATFLFNFSTYHVFIDDQAKAPSINKLRFKMLQLQTGSYLSTNESEDYYVSYDDASELLGTVRAILQNDVGGEGMIEENKINSFEVLEASCQFLKKIDLQLYQAFHNCLVLNLATKLCRCKGVKTYEKIVVLMVICNALEKELSLENVRATREKFRSLAQKNTVIKPISDRYERFVRSLPLFACQTAIMKENTEKALWKTIKQLALISYRILKFDERVSDHYELTLRLFEVLYTLASKHPEIFNKAVLVADQELLQILLAPSPAFQKEIKLESKFFSRSLNCGYYQKILFEIKLNGRMANNQIKLPCRFRDFVTNLVQTDEKVTGAWVRTYFEDFLEFKPWVSNSDLTVTKNLAKSKELWLVKYYTGEPKNVIEYLISAIGPVEKQYIDALTDSLEKTVLGASELNIREVSKMLSGTLMHLITLVNHHNYYIPYLVSRKFMWISPKKGLFFPLPEQKELSLIEFLLIPSFVFQPWLVETFLLSLIQGGNVFFTAPTEKEPYSVTLSYEIMLAAVRTVTEAVEKILSEFLKTKQLFLLHILNNYCGLLTQCQNAMISHFKSLALAGKIRFFSHTEALVSQFWQIYLELEFKKSGYDSLKFEEIYAFVLPFYQNMVDEDGAEWVNRNARFVLALRDNFMTKKSLSFPASAAFLSASKSSTQVNEPSEVVMSFVFPQTDYTHFSNQSKTNYYHLPFKVDTEGTSEMAFIENFERNSIFKDNSDIDKHDEAGKSKPLKEMAQKRKQKAKNANSIENLERDLLSNRGAKIEKASKASLVQTISSSLPEFKGQYRITALSNPYRDPVEDIAATISGPSNGYLVGDSYPAMNWDTISAPNKQMEEPALKRNVATILEKIAKAKLELLSEQKPEIQTDYLSEKTTEFRYDEKMIIQPEALKEEFKEEEVKLPEDDVQVSFDNDLLETLCEMGEMLLPPSCELLRDTQKQYVESVFLEEIDNTLPNTRAKAEEITAQRKKYLKKYISELPIYQQKLFWLFLPKDLKMLVDPKIATTGDEFYEICLDSIKQLLKKDNLRQYSNEKLFETLKELAFMNSVKRKEQIYHQTREVAKKNSEQKQPISTGWERPTTLKAFEANPANLEKTKFIHSWFWLEEQTIEKIVIKIALGTYKDTDISNLAFLNPLNALRINTALLELVEDASLAKFYKLLESAGMKFEVRYSQICLIILSFFQAKKSIWFDLALKTPTKSIIPYLPSTLTNNANDAYLAQTGLDRILNLLDLRARFEDKEALFSSIAALVNSFKDTGISAHQDHSPDSIAAVHTESFEKLWVAFVEIEQRKKEGMNNPLFTALAKLLPETAFFEAIKYEFSNYYLFLLTSAQNKIRNNAKQVSTIPTDPISQEVDSLDALNNLLSGAIIHKFEDLVDRKSFEQLSAAKKKELIRCTKVLQTFLTEIANSKDAKAFLVHSFESLWEDYENKKNPRRFNETQLKKIFKLLICLNTVLTLVNEIVLPSEHTPDELELNAIANSTSLHRCVSKDVAEYSEVLPVLMTFSQMTSNGSSLHLNDIVVHSVMKFNKENIKTLLRIGKIDEVSKQLFLKKFSFLQNLSQKETDAGLRDPPPTVYEVVINRTNHLLDSIEFWSQMPKEDRMKYKPKITYMGEIGIDQGGLIRSWFTENTKILFNPQFGLFAHCSTHAVHPSIISKLVPNHLAYFEFAGYHIALAIKTKTFLDVHFTRSFYKRMLGAPYTLDDLEEIDSSLYQGLQWMLQNDAEKLHQTFSYEVDVCGKRHHIELVPGGSDIIVNNKNKQLYVKLLVVSKLEKEIDAEMEAFLEGFNSVLPLNFLTGFSPGELDSIIAGASKIEIENLKAIITLSSFFSPEFKEWFWEVIEGLDQKGRSAFLYFVTGSARLPYEGVQAGKITVSKVEDLDKLPIAHTCSLNLEIPQYKSKEVLKEKLEKSIYEGAGSFMIK